MTNKNEITGMFFGHTITIINQNTMRMAAPQDIDHEEFKPTLIRIGKYLVDEGFLTTKTPRVEIKTKKCDE